MKKTKSIQPPERYVFNSKKYTQLRKARGYTLEDLAIKTGITLQTLCRYGTKTQRAPKTPNMALLLADALGCSIYDLYIKKDSETEVEL